MKAVFEGIFQPLINSAQMAAWVVEALVLGVGIGLLKMYVAAKPAVRAVSDLLGFDTSGFDLEATLAAVSRAAEFLAPAIAIVAVGIGAVVTAVGLLGAAVVGLQLGLIVTVLSAVVSVFYAVGSAVHAAAMVVAQFGASVGAAIGGAVRSAIDYLRGVSLVDVGLNMIAGLVAGIQAGASSVVAAMTGVAQGAISAVTSTLGIASPSKVMRRLMRQTGAGAELGANDAAPGVQRAFTGMVEPPTIADPVAATGAEPTRGGRGAGIVVTVEAGAIIIQDAEGEGVVDRLREAVTQIFEGAATQLAGA
jgi:hypothetical protein